MPDGSIRLLIGIADVDALVTRGTATDEHAATNTTSVYTGVCTFHMLPARLSTDLTSLNEGEDRNAIVIEMRVAADGTMTPVDAYRAVVHNYAKLDYESCRGVVGEPILSTEGRCAERSAQRAADDYSTSARGASATFVA